MSSTACSTCAKELPGWGKTGRTMAPLTWRSRKSFYLHKITSLRYVGTYSNARWLVKIKRWNSTSCLAADGLPYLLVLENTLKNKKKVGLFYSLKLGRQFSSTGVLMALCFYFKSSKILIYHLMSMFTEYQSHWECFKTKEFYGQIHLGQCYMTQFPSSNSTVCISILAMYITGKEARQFYLTKCLPNHHPFFHITPTVFP